MTPINPLCRHVFCSDAGLQYHPGLGNYLKCRYCDAVSLYRDKVTMLEKLGLVERI